MRSIRNGFIGLAILLLTCLVILGVTHEGRVAVATGLLVSEVLPNSRWRPLAGISGPPIVEETEYAYVGGEGTGTVFRPNDGNQHGAVILFLGVNPDLEDVTLRRTAEALAREGVVVLLPKPVELVQGKVSPLEVENLIGAFRFLRAATYVEPKRIGYAGFCVGSSLSLIAAADPRISSDVRFVNFFGGYFSAPDLLTAMTTHQVPLGDTSQPWEPNQDAVQWFSQQLVSAVSDKDDRETLERTLKAGRVGSDEVLAMSPGARSVYLALTNRDVARAPLLYEELPDEVKAYFERLSPSAALDWLQAKVFIMHDRNDSYVPYVESERLMEALTAAEYPRKYYTQFDIFQHMHPDRALPPFDFAREVGKLYVHLFLIMLELA